MIADPFIWIVAPLIAGGVAVVLMQIASTAAAGIRRRDFLRFEDFTKDDIKTRFTLPEVAGPASVDVLGSLGNLLRTLHAEAIEAQNSYHSNVSRAASSLVLAFCALAISASPLREFYRIHAVVVWLDVILLACVILHFIRAKSASRRWLRCRAHVETMRQFQFLFHLFPTALRHDERADLTSEFEEYSGRATAEVQQSVTAEQLASRVEALWSDLRFQIERSPPSNDAGFRKALLLYLRKRVLRQLGWFTDSAMRLRHDAERRKRFLQYLYFAALLIAIAKLAAVLLHWHPVLSEEFDLMSIDAWSTLLYASLLPLLLITTGLSAALTAYYVNQNARSLIHRYASQKRFIEEWIQFMKVGGLWPNEQSSEVANTEELQSHILKFESLMMDELIDWIFITDSDTIEISL